MTTPVEQWADRYAVLKYLVGARFFDHRYEGNHVLGELNRSGEAYEKSRRAARRLHHSLSAVRVPPLVRDVTEIEAATREIVNRLGIPIAAHSTDSLGPLLGRVATLESHPTVLADAEAAATIAPCWDRLVRETMFQSASYPPVTNVAAEGTVTALVDALAKADALITKLLNE